MAAARQSVLPVIKIKKKQLQASQLITGITSRTPVPVLSSCMLAFLPQHNLPLPVLLNPPSILLFFCPLQTCLGGQHRTVWLQLSFTVDRQHGSYGLCKGRLPVSSLSFWYFCMDNCKPITMWQSLCHFICLQSGWTSGGLNLRNSDTARKDQCEKSLCLSSVPLCQGPLYHYTQFAPPPEMAHNTSSSCICLCR